MEITVEKKNAIKLDNFNILDYDYVGEFHEGLAIVQKYDKCGFIDKTGNEVIKTEYNYANDFHEDLAIVTKNYKSSFIEKTGNEVINMEYNYANDFHEGFAKIRKDGELGFIDKTGNEVVKISYDYVANFHEGLAAIGKYDKYGFIDKAGRLIIKVEYDKVSDFQNGFARVVKNGKCGLIDKNGNVWSECIYNTINISDGMIVLDNKYLIDLEKLQRTFNCLVTINGETFEKEFETEKKRDKYIRILNAYIDGRTGRRESEINEKKRELEPLIKKLEEDILSIENSYCEDIKKKIEDYYKNYKM